MASPLDEPIPRCPQCGGMMSGDTTRLECVPPPDGILPVEPEEWCAGCHVVLVWNKATQKWVREI